MTKDNPILAWERRRLWRPVWWRSPRAIVWLWAGTLLLNLVLTLVLRGWYEFFEDDPSVRRTLDQWTSGLSVALSVLHIVWLAALTWTVARTWGRDLPGGEPAEIFATPVSAGMLLRARTWIWVPHLILMTIAVTIFMASMLGLNMVAYTTTMGWARTIPWAFLIDAVLSFLTAAGFFLTGVVALALGTHLALRQASPFMAALAVAVLEGALAGAEYGALLLTIRFGFPGLLIWVIPVFLVIQGVLAVWFAQGLTARVERLRSQGR